MSTEDTTKKTSENTEVNLSLVDNTKNENDTSLDTTDVDHTAFNNKLLSDVNTELSTMMKYALAKGKTIPAGLSDLIDSKNLGDKLKAHNELVATVSPATPQSIKYLSQFIDLDETSVKELIKFPLIRRLLIIAILSLLITIGVSLSPDVNEQSLSKGLLESSGLVLLQDLVFVCASALLGVMFYLLKNISNQVRDCTLIQEDIVETNTLIIIGTISGFIISELFVFSVSNFTGSIEVHKMTLALLGGFSSDAIFSALQGLINKIKAFVAPTTG